jgi:DNA-binding transcriptional MerR regulator
MQYGGKIVNPAPGIAAKSLMKAGELAKAAGVLVTTIRFYTKEGLLKSDAESQGGYNLYQPEKALSTIRLINSLKEKRYTLTEIKALLTHQIMAERGVS